MGSANRQNKSEVLILNATHRVTVRPDYAGHASTAATEAQST